MLKNLFKIHSFGLDFSDESIKFIELIKVKKHIKIGRFGEKKLPVGVIEEGEIKDLEEIEKILKVFKKEYKIKSANLPLTLEDRAQAVIRAVIKKNDRETYMIIDLSKKYAGVFIASQNILMYSTLLNIQNVEALDLCTELMRHFVFWHKNKEKSKIKKIILVGDNSNLIKFSEYLAVKMKIKVELADVWVNIFDIKKYIPEMGFIESLRFSQAIGLALEGFE